MAGRAGACREGEIGGDSSGWTSRRLQRGADRGQIGGDSSGWTRRRASASLSIGGTRTRGRDTGGPLSPPISPYLPLSLPYLPSISPYLPAGGRTRRGLAPRRRADGGRGRACPAGGGGRRAGLSISGAKHACRPLLPSGGVLQRRRLRERADRAYGGRRKRRAGPQARQLWLKHISCLGLSGVRGEGGRGGFAH